MDPDQPAHPHSLIRITNSITSRETDGKLWYLADEGLVPEGGLFPDDGLLLLEWLLDRALDGGLANSTTGPLDGRALFSGNGMLGTSDILKVKLFDTITANYFPFIHSGDDSSLNVFTPL
jgi:hypothetical protein